MTAISLTAIPSALFAQACDAHPRSAGTSWALTGAFASYAYANSLGVSVAIGHTLRGTPASARLGIARVRDDELDASTTDVTLGAELEFRPTGRNVILCPIATVGAAFGPYDFLLSGEDYRYLDASLGAAGAVILSESRQLRVMPVVELRAVWLHAGWLVPLSDETLRRSGSDIYGVAGAHLAIRLRERLSLRPGITIPFGLVPPDGPDAFIAPFGRENSEISRGMSVSFEFGQKD